MQLCVVAITVFYFLLWRRGSNRMIELVEGGSCLMRWEEVV
jgi:hypothetical protein